MCKAWIGFDAFVDKIMRPVQEHKEDQIYYFNTIANFAKYIESAAGKSADIELVQQCEKFGGNAPILAHALQQLGIQTYCVAPFGNLNDEVWCNGFNKNVVCHSIGYPATCTSYEFDDGKLMLSDLTPLHSLTWDKIKSNQQFPAILEELLQADLVALVDWSNGKQMTDLWQNIFRLIETEHNLCKNIFIDFADPFKCSKNELENILNVIQNQQTKARVHIGVNEHESELIAQSLNIIETDLTKRVKRMALKTHSCVVIHTLDAAYASNGKENAYVKSIRVEKPVLSTGGGDHFNAGYCYALINGMSIEQRLRIANVSSHYYVKTGISPEKNNIL